MVGGFADAFSVFVVYSSYSQVPNGTDECKTRVIDRLNALTQGLSQTTYQCSAQSMYEYILFAFVITYFTVHSVRIH